MTRVAAAALVCLGSLAMVAGQAAVECLVWVCAGAVFALIAIGDELHNLTNTKEK